MSRTEQPQRLFLAAQYRQSWPAERPIVIKVEVDAEATNRRAVVTNRPGWEAMPAAIYEDYVERGESENRNKELKRESQGDRLSDHRFLANFFRSYLHAFALNLPVSLRQTVAQCRPRPPSWGCRPSCRRRRLMCRIASGSSTVVVAAIRWGRASPAPGGRG